MTTQTNTDNTNTNTNNTGDSMTIQNEKMTVKQLTIALQAHDFTAPKSYKKAQLVAKLARFEKVQLKAQLTSAIEYVKALPEVDAPPVAPTTCPIEQAAWLVAMHLAGSTIDMAVVDACFGVALKRNDKLGRTKVYDVSFWALYIQYKNGVKVYTGRPVARELAKSGYMGTIDKAAGTLSLVTLVKRTTYTARKR